jgi:pentatricopeptide repeat protein
VLLQERSVAERAKFHFYLAKTYAKAGNVERALQYMRKAIEEGFKERNKFMEESEFGAMRELPEFQQLMAMEVRVL